MPSPFPGMNPYLEHPEMWPAVHTNLIVELQYALAPQLPKHYFVAIQLREYEVSLAEADLIGIGDVSITGERGNGRGINGPHQTVDAWSGGEREPARAGVLMVELPRLIPVRERYLEIRNPRTHELITVIEVLSPTNKRGEGRRQYEAKRQDLFSSLTNLVEIDLIRTGVPLPVRYRGGWLPRQLAGDYRVLVARGTRRKPSELYTVSLREPLPVIPIPLRPDEVEPTIDLQAILHTVYDRGIYYRAIDYRQEPVPPLSPEDAAWADRLLREQGLR